MARNQLATEDELEFGGDEFFQPTDLSFVAPAAAPATVSISPTEGFTPEALAYVTRPGALERRVDDVRDLLADDFQLYKQLGESGDTWGGKTTTYQAYDPYGGAGQTFEVKEGGLGEGLQQFAELAAPLVLSAGAGTALGNALGLSGSTATSIGNALISGAVTGDPTKALTAGVSSLISPYISDLGKAASEAVGGGMPGDVVSKAIAGAGSSALGAALRGGDVESALLSGALGGGANVLASGLTETLGLPEPVTRVATTGLTSALLGKDVGQSVANAALGEILRAASQPSVTDTGDETERLLARFPAPIPDTGDEVDRLLARYPEASLEPDFVVEQTPSGAVVRDTAGETFQGATEEPIFLGEGVPSGVQAWDAAAIAAGVPLEGVTGNLEQDFVVAQTRDGPVIVDDAGNVGEFVDGEWVVRSDPKDFSTYVAPSPAPAPAAAPKPAPAPAPAAKPKDDLDALLLALSMMQQQRAPEEYRVAQITARNPFGTIFDETTQEDLLRILRG